MKLSEFERKDVVDVRSGKKLGMISDVELSEDCLSIQAIYVCDIGWKDFILIFRKTKMCKITLNQIVSIGKDVVLVNI